MAKEKNPDTKTEQKEETVSIRLPILSGEDPIQFVGLNGKGYTIKRGERVEVPKEIADLLEESEARKQAKQQRMMRLRTNGTGTIGF